MVTKFYFQNENRWKRDICGRWNINYKHYINVIFFKPQLDAKSTLPLWDSSCCFFLKETTPRLRQEVSAAAHVCSTIKRIGLLQYSSLKLIFENVNSQHFPLPSLFKTKLKKKIAKLTFHEGTKCIYTLEDANKIFQSNIFFSPRFLVFVPNTEIMNIVLKTQDLAYSVSHKLYITFSNWKRKIG